MKKLTVVDLFAGCGGLSLGLEQAGFQSVYVNELNNDAMESYLINRDLENPYLRERFHSNDVKSMILDKKYIPNLSKDLKNTYNLDVKSGELDLIVGAPARIFRDWSQKIIFCKQRADSIKFSLSRHGLLNQ